MAVADRSDPVEGSRVNPSDLSSTHLKWMQGLLAESPATLQDISLGRVADVDVTMEWQAVFQGAGVAYFRTLGNVILVCLLLDGRHPTSEHAAIDAVQQSVQSTRARTGGFELVRKHTRRPLRALVLTDITASRDLLSAVEYWSDCLATAYFGALGGGPVEEAAGERQHPHMRAASAM